MSRGQREVEHVITAARSRRSRCALCKKRPHGDLVLDHDHRTGRARDFVCQRCNMFLGWVDRYGERLVQLYDDAIEYKARGAAPDLSRLRFDRGDHPRPKITLDPSYGGSVVELTCPRCGETYKRPRADWSDADMCNVCYRNTARHGANGGGPSPGYPGPDSDAAEGRAA